MIVMLGGMATHLIFDGGRNMTSEVVPLVLSSIVFVLRRHQVTALFERLRGSDPAAALPAGS
jgi:hypothetical protein